MTVNIVEDTLSGYGLRVLHGLSFQYPIEVAEMMALVPLECKELATYYPVIERDLKIFHMYAAWQVREVVDFSRVNEVPARKSNEVPAPSSKSGSKVAESSHRNSTGATTPPVPIRYGVLWYINTRAGETMSLAIELAAAMYHDQIGRWPTAVWMRAKPKAAPDAYVIIRNKYEKHKDARECKQYSLLLEEANWVPEKFIVAGIPGLELEWKDGKFVDVGLAPSPLPSPAAQEGGNEEILSGAYVPWEKHPGCKTRDNTPLQETML